MNILLGSTYVDKISGFKGVATGHCTYITGCSQTLLQPVSKDSKAKPDAHWFDDQRLELVGGAKRVILDNGTTPGSDIPAPIR